jgi:hypothetical protein
LHELTIATKSSVTKEAGQGYCHCGRTTEEACRKKDSIISDNIRSIISRLCLEIQQMKSSGDINTDSLRL